MREENNIKNRANLMIQMFLRVFRSFNWVLGIFLEQRAAKVLAVKVEDLKKKSALLAITSEVCASACGPGSSPTEFH